MHYIVNEDNALQSLSLGGARRDHCARNFRITQKKTEGRERQQFEMCTVSRYICTTM